MRTLDRNKRKLWVSSIVPNGNLKTYKEPIAYMENYQVTNNNEDENAYGIEAYNYIRIKTNISHKSYYNVGDRIYINKTPPEEYDKLAKNADYEVFKEPVVSLNECEVMLRKEKWH